MLVYPGLFRWYHQLTPQQKKWAQDATKTWPPGQAKNGQYMVYAP